MPKLKPTTVVAHAIKTCEDLTGGRIPSLDFGVLYVVEGVTETLRIEIWGLPYVGAEASLAAVAIPRSDWKKGEIEEQIDFAFTEAFEDD